MAEDFNIGRMKAEAIAKAFGIDVEKGHEVGDIHPNGKWVWTQLPSGKFDWRVRKQSSGEQGGNGKSTSSTDSDSKKQEQGGLEAHAQNASDEALKRASQDPNAAPEVKAAAEAEMKKRGVSEEKEDKKADESSKDSKSKKKFSDIKTVSQAEKELLGKFVKINGKEAKIIGADKSKYDGEVYVKVVAEDDFLHKMKTITLKELDAGKTSSNYKDNFWGKKDEELSVEVLDKEPQKEVVTKESLDDFIGFLNRNIKNKDSDEVINAEFKFLSTVPRKYLSSESNIHNRVVSTIRKLMTELK